MAKVQIYGLEDIRKELATTRISATLARNVNAIVMDVHEGLRDLIARKYSDKYSSLTTVRMRKSADLVKQGKGFIISGSLEYKFRPVNLFKHLDHRYMGNTAPNRLNPKIPKRQGKVAVVEIKRGDKKATIGRRGYGGFVVKRKRTNVTWLVERRSEARKPFDNLFAPSLASLVAYNIETPEAKAIIDKASLKIVDNIF